MIRINLLPTKRKVKKKPKPVPNFVIVGVLLLTASVVASVYTRYFLNAKIEALETKKAENAKKIAELNEKIKEVKDFEARNKLFTDRKNIIEDLRKNQSLPVKILDEMSMRLTEGVWLISISITGNNINIDGVGFSNSEIVSFVQNLKASALFKEAYLHETRQAAIEGIEVYTFKITMQV
ncbi:MAG: PilN domain-containing protein [Thermodesulfovibrionales bacterium]|nr:PilN domain-containing protein [Thermodesulfovibrionales bacterium]